MPKFAIPIALVLATVAPAGPAIAEEASATLKILSGSSMAADWYGEGGITMRKQLCVSSSTGRYTLDVNIPGTIFGKASGDSAIEVRFADAAGFGQSKNVSGPSQLVFSGTSAPGAEQCASDTLASIEIYVPATTLTSQPAGNYFDQISLAVRPL